MLISDCLDVNEYGHLTIGGADTVSLAERFGTPLYCLSENEIRSACRGYTAAMKKHYGANGAVAYASKALSCKELCRIVKSEGLSLDVVSAGELHTAICAGFPLERIFFHGNNKTHFEIEYAIETGVGIFVVDNLFELREINAVARSKGRVQSVMLRIKPGVDAHTHHYIMTGSIDSKFGFALENGEAMDAVKEALTLDNLCYKGLHCHIGSQIFETEPFCEAARIMLRFIKDISVTLHASTEMLNLGGGFGIKYTPKNKICSADEFLGRVSKAVKSEAEKLDVDVPFMVVEPGRSIVAPAGITLYTVGGIKKIEGIRTYVSVDGGMTDNPRYALYSAEYTAVIANKALNPADQRVTIAGRCCESGDLLQENTLIQEAEPGDILAVLATGAYNYSMASNYNRIPRPEMVMVSDGEAKVIIKRETLDDVVRNDL